MQMKNSSTKTLITLAMPGVAGAAAAQAGQLTATIEIPQLDVAEYHRPYIAAWVESAERELVTNLAVWYDIEMKDREGETWLKDLRQWWRKGGRSLEMPIDGISGPTKPVGEHELSVNLNTDNFSAMNAGTYYFVVEASREVGGRELLRIPFEWKDSVALDETISGERELGKVTLEIKK